MVEREPLSEAQMKRMVIVGAGFAGLAAARALRHSDAEVFVVDRANHNLFQPLLYRVATTVLSPAQIASSICGFLQKQRNTTVILGEVGRWQFMQAPATELIIGSLNYLGPEHRKADGTSALIVGNKGTR